MMRFLPLLFGLLFALVSACQQYDPQTVHGRLAQEAKGLDPKVLEMALGAASKAWSRGLAGKRILTVIDYSLPSTRKRLWVIDVRQGKVLFREMVSHGKGSGEREAQSFSNQVGSLASSLGLYRATSTYVGEHGYTLRLVGLEKGFNDNAIKRRIVLHGASYATEEFARRHGRLGVSWGCPAVDPLVAESLIDTIKGGSLLFIYYPDRKWLTESKFLDRDRQAGGRAYLSLPQTREREPTTSRHRPV